MLPQLLLTACLAITTLAKPLPASASTSLNIADIERRWAAGDSEASIHASRTHRDATPAWPVAREAEAMMAPEAFSYATDERTMLQAQRKARRSESTPTLAKMRAFVANFYRQRGKSDKGLIARDAQDVQEMAPVLKPRRGMRYSFTA